jgi:predicted transcriptional regulator
MNRISRPKKRPAVARRGARGCDHMSATGIRTYLEPDIAREVARIARAQGRSESSFIADAVRATLAKGSEAVARASAETQGRRLNRIEARIDRLFRDQALMKESSCSSCACGWSTIPRWMTPLRSRPLRAPKLGSSASLTSPLRHWLAVAPNACTPPSSPIATRKTREVIA